MTLLRPCLLFLLIALLGCSATKLPSEPYDQFTYTSHYTFDQDTLRITLENPLHCPLRVWIQSADTNVQQRLRERSPVVLPGRSDTILHVADIDTLADSLLFASRLGDPALRITPTMASLPFPKHKTYTILQGNNTDFTHNTDYSRYALDFDLAVNDTVCSATSGYVVGVTDQYKRGGNGPEWRPFGNFITIYDATAGLFYQYAHLTYRGSFVAVGDTVVKGQPIAHSGATGQRTVAHLHFNCLKPVHTEAGLQSVPIVFDNGLPGIDLKKGDVVGH